MEKVIQYNGATVTVRRGTVRSRLLSTLIYGKLNVAKDMSDADYIFMTNYASFLTQTSVKGKLGIPKPPATADEKEIRAGLEAFLEADTDFYDAILGALLEVDAPLNDPELAPDVDPKD